MFDPAIVGPEAIIVRQFRAAHRVAQLRELMIDSGDDEDVALASFEYPARRGVRDVTAAARRLDSASAQAVHLDCRLVAMKIGVEQRDVEELALAGALAMQQ